jgi:hypothetical protein
LKILTPVLAFALFAAPFTAARATGAIAVDDEVGRSANDVGYGYVIDRDSREEAENGAMRECRHHGNDSCRVAVWFDQCGAYASSREHSGTGYGNSDRVARARAMDECGSDRCRIVVSACDSN